MLSHQIEKVISRRFQARNSVFSFYLIFFPEKSSESDSARAIFPADDATAGAFLYFASSAFE